jgi:hypothetical protein
MPVLGVRCEKEAIAYVLLDGTPEAPTVLEHNRVTMQGSSRPEQLQWLRKEIRELITRTGAEVLAFKAPETKRISSQAPFSFEDRGEHELKGVPGAWRLFAITAG